MAYPANTVFHFRPADRLFDIIHSLILFFDTVSVARQAVDGLPVVPSLMRSASSQFPVCVTFSSHGQFKALFTPGGMVGLSHHSLEISPQQSFNPTASRGFNEVFTLILNGALVIFYERYAGSLKDKFGDPDKWPEIFRFARAMRNAAVHAEGRLLLRPRDRPVVWHHLTYTQADNGQRVLGEVGKHLGPADIVMLLLDFSAALDLHGIQ